MPEVLELEHLSFPWLWRSSETGLLKYALDPAVELVTAQVHDRMVGYVGYTLQGSRGIWIVTGSSGVPGARLRRSASFLCS